MKKERKVEFTFNSIKKLFHSLISTPEPVRMYEYIIYPLHITPYIPIQYWDLTLETNLPSTRLKLINMVTLLQST